MFLTFVNTPKLLIMANLSFDITNSKDFYNKLIEDYEDYKVNYTTSRHAINCAMTAWHLGEWLYYEYSTQLIASFPNWANYRDHLKSNECTNLETMHRITNGSKHCLSGSASQKVQSTEKHIGDFSNDFSREFDQTALIVKMDDGSEVWFEDELEAVVAFWKDYIPRTFNIIII